MSPLFNNEPIFDSIIGSGSDETNYTEGVLWLPEYTKIRQKIHFNGADGDRYLTHGFPDRVWIFRGLISAPSMEDLTDRLNAIYGYIDDADADDSTYSPLTDSFGSEYQNAQIHHCHIADIRAAEQIDGIVGYIATVQVSGIIKGSQHDGPLGSGL